MRVLKIVGAHKFIGLVTDEARNMSGMRNLVLLDESCAHIVPLRSASAPDFMYFADI